MTIKSILGEKTLYLPATLKTVESKSSNEDGKIWVEGYASTKHQDRHTDIVSVDVWTEKTISDFLVNPVMLYNHNHNKIIGNFTELKADENGLYVKGWVYKSFEHSQQIVDGVLKSFSIGFIIKDADYDEKDDIFTIKALELLEISSVTIPANGFATFQVSKYFSDAELKTIKKSFIHNTKNDTNMFKFLQTFSSLMLAKYAISVGADLTEASSDEDIQKSIIQTITDAKSVTDLVDEAVTEKTAAIQTQLDELISASEKSENVEDAQSKSVMQVALVQLQKSVKENREKGILIEKRLNDTLGENKNLKETIDKMVLGDVKLEEGATIYSTLTQGTKSFVDDAGNVEIEGDSRY
jgi:HK97 family phage prohead protease